MTKPGSEKARESGGFKLRFKDRADWFEAAICLTFLIVFPAAIYAVWLQPGEDAPLVFSIPFTALFLLCVPALVKTVLKARSRTFTLQPAAHTIAVKTWRPFRTVTRRLPYSQITALIFEASDNDGYWYRGMIQFPQDETLIFTQGSYRPGMRAEFDAMVALLRQGPAHIRVREIEN